MNKTQFLFVGLAIVLVGVLYSLPRVVVEGEGQVRQSGGSDQKTRQAPEKASANKGEKMGRGNATNAGMPEKAHQSELSGPQKEKLASIRKKLHNTSSKSEKFIKFADSLAEMYSRFHIYDSAAIYREKIVRADSSVENRIKAGLACYDAFSFSSPGKKTGEWVEKTRDYLKSALEKRPERTDLKIKLALTHVASGRPMNGIRKLQNIAKENPENAEVQFQLGLLSIRSGQYEKATQRFRKTLELDSGRTQAQYYLGISLKRSGNKNGALEVFKKVKENSKDSVLINTADRQIKQLKN